MKLGKILSTAVAAFVSLSTIAISLTTTFMFSATLVAATLLTACGNDSTAGTDEQPNAITAQIDAAVDSASAIWFQGEKTFTAESRTGLQPTNPPSHDIIITDSLLHNTSLISGIKTEHGILQHLEIAYFAMLSCETKETWFSYAVQVTSSLIQKTFTIPDTTAASTAKDFETDCTHEGGEFITETESATEGQQSYSCKIIPTKENLVENNAIQYSDPNWEKYGKQIIGICRK